MIARRIHKYAGLLLLLPLLGWAATGVVFLVKPGYEAAYERLLLKTYPLDTAAMIPVMEGWEEIRIVRSVLGRHLLVRSKGELLHLDPGTLERRPVPNEAEMRLLLEDAIAVNSRRYGQIEAVDGLKAHTSTGVEISLDWNELKYSQQGLDRDLIELLYKIHYLQWTPWAIFNQILGVLGLLSLTLLTAMGLKLYIENGRIHPRKNV